MKQKSVSYIVRPELILTKLMTHHYNLILVEHLCKVTKKVLLEL